MKANIISPPVVADSKEQALIALEQLDMKPGDVVVCALKGNVTKLFICCPGCGSSSFTGTHKITILAGQLSAKPSLKFNCCDWHGYLTNNIFKK